MIYHILILLIDLRDHFVLYVLRTGIDNIEFKFLFFLYNKILLLVTVIKNLIKRWGRREEFHILGYFKKNSKMGRTSHYPCSLLEKLHMLLKNRNG